MKTSTQLTRICAVCGIQKPLSAFLQISGAHGTTYGTVCATCRSAGLKEKTAAPIEDERSPTGAGTRIGAKEKVFMEKEQIRQAKDVKELHKKEIKERDELETKKFESIQAREKAEKEHRKNYLETKKQQGFLGRTTTPVSAEKTPVHQDETAYVAEAQKQEEVSKQEQRATSIDTTAPFITTQTGEIKYQSSIFLSSQVFQEMKKRLKSSAPHVIDAMEKLYGGNEAAKSAEPTKTELTSEQKHIIEDYINHTTGPSRRR